MSDRSPAAPAPRAHPPTRARAPRGRLRGLGLALAGALALAGCDDTAEVANVGPEVGLVGWCVAANRTYVVVTVSDPERDDVDLQLRFEGGATGTLAPGPTGSGLVGLSSARSPESQVHRIEWGAACAEGDPSCADPCLALEVSPALPGPTPTCTPRPASVPADLTARVWARNRGEAELAFPTEGEAPAPLPELGPCPAP